MALTSPANAGTSPEGCVGGLWVAADLTRKRKLAITLGATTKSGQAWPAVGEHRTDSVCTIVPRHRPAHQPLLEGLSVIVIGLPFLADPTARLARDSQAVPEGPVTLRVSARSSEPNRPVATGILKRKAKCVRGVPEAGLTVTRVVGPSPAAVADPAITASSAAASAQHMVHRLLTSTRIMDDLRRNALRPHRHPALTTCQLPPPGPLRPWPLVVPMVVSPE